LIHGREDMVVPFGAMALAEAVLKAHDIPLETHARAGLGHGIDPDGLTIAGKFLKAKLA
jgi:phospholipase/carboxylesterase